VWVGRAANYAAKLTGLDDPPTWITDAVFQRLSKEAKYTNGRLMWTPRTWTQMNDVTIHCSDWWWPF
jgi:class 3 adenylate cyclase